MRQFVRQFQDLDLLALGGWPGGDDDETGALDAAERLPCALAAVVALEGSELLQVVQHVKPCARACLCGGHGDAVVAGGAEGCDQLIVVVVALQAFDDLRTLHGDDDAGLELKNHVWAALRVVGLGVLQDDGPLIPLVGDGDAGTGAVVPCG